MNFFRLFRQVLPALGLLTIHQSSFAQTDNDADMMAKGLFCAGPMYSYSSWDHYWEGKLNRTNENLGTVSTKTISVMGNYGISKKLNILFNVPYVQTKASAGTMAGLKGFQDLSLFLKWKPLKMDLGKGKFSLAAVAGYSTPLTNYAADYLPLSIGLQSQNLTGRVIADYQYKKFFVTGAAAYVYRNNIKIDRTAYYTTEMHYTNEVKMPDAGSFHVRTGYRSKTLLLEAVFMNWTTFGGFDITRNNMPFPSNRMNMTTAGPSIKWRPNGIVKGFTLHAGADFTLKGRNVGQAQTIYGGIYYIFNINHKN
ncbi:MAG TPA: hypothetical protein VHK91_11465 [Flavisolibacter sp.]|jgi:hypothetical protein|nr:hypothetical protein [Flavisolibacter sp.]